MKKIFASALALGTFILCNHAWSAGYDLTFPVSARYAAIGGAAVSSTTATEAVVLNPAALSKARGLDLAAELAPVWVRYKGPVVRNDAAIDSKTAFTPFGAAFSSYKVTPDLGIGVGIYGGGGVGADYGQVDFGGYHAKPEIKSLLYSIETSVGAGYRINENFSVGAAWRISTIGGELSSATVLGGTLVNTKFDAMSGSNFGGFRVGGLYENDDRTWGLGMTLRNNVEWKAKGKASVTTSSASASHTADLGDVTLTTDLPIQVAVGGHHKGLVTDLGLFLQYEFTHYNKVQDQKLMVGTTPSDQKLSWKNGHTVRLGTEYTGIETWALRFGYIFSTPVVPRDRPSIFLNPTSPIHAFALGAGKTISERLSVDGCANVAFASSQSTPAPDSTSFRGDYAAISAAAQASLTYLF